MENNPSQAPVKKKKNKNKVFIPVIAITVIVLLTAIYFYRDYAKYISSDDARIDADNVSVGAKIMGRIAHLYADEGDTVQKGKLLADLDSTDLLAQKKQTVASRGQAVAALTQAEARFRYDQESIKVLEINFARSQDDFNRAKEQFKGEVITQEQIDHAKRAYETAKAQLDAARTQLLVSKAQIGSAEASVVSASAQVGVINTQLSNTRIYASMDGIVAKRWLLPGDIAQAGQSIFTLTSHKNHWVTVFLEETKVGHIHIGQKVRFTIDAYSGVHFTGKIFFIGSNTASQFSLIPPNNASGNFTKVTQRVPIKISIDGTEEKDDLSGYDLMAGMSVVAKIIR